MKQEILKKTRYTEKEYQMILLDTFFMWCNEQSINDNHYQMLVVNQKIFVWFIKEYNHNQKTFLDYTNNYNNSIQLVQEFRDLYDKITSKINFYPKVLLQEVRKKVKKENGIYNNNFN